MQPDLYMQPDLNALNALKALQEIALHTGACKAGLMQQGSTAAVQLTLPRLQRLCLQNFALHSLSVVDCPMLQACCLACCSLHGAVQLPVAVTSLTLVCSILASEEWLPSALSRLSRLAHLNLCGNALQALPRLDMLTGLHILDARWNGFTSLPSLPPHLCVLLLGKNRLTEVPAEVERLLGVRVVSLGEQRVDMQITRPLSPLLALPRLGRLHLGGCSQWSMRSKQHLGLFLEEAGRRRSKLQAHF